MDFTGRKTMELVYVPGEISLFTRLEEVNTRITLNGGYVCFFQWKNKDLDGLADILPEAIIPEGTVVKNGKISMYVRFTTYDTLYVKRDIDLLPDTVMTIIDFSSYDYPLHVGGGVKDLVLAEDEYISGNDAFYCNFMGGFHFSPIAKVRRTVFGIEEIHNEYLGPIVRIRFLNKNAYALFCESQKLSCPGSIQ